MTEPTGLIPMTLAARRFGVSEPTFRRRVREGGLPVFADPRDRRRRLLRVADVDRLDTLGRGDPAGAQEVA